MARYETVGDMVLIYDDLLITKEAEITPLLAFQLYQSSLLSMQSDLKAASGFDSGIPLVDALKAENGVHDSSGRLLYYLCEGFSGLSTLSAVRREFWKKVQQTFIPSLSLLRASYEDEASAAKTRVEDLDMMKGEMESVEIGEGMTLYGLTAAYLNAGINIGTLLSERADKKVDESVKRATLAKAIRSKAIGLLNEFRQAVAQEVASNESLPRDMETRLFAFADQIGDTRENRAKSDVSDEQLTESSEASEQASGTESI